MEWPNFFNQGVIRHVGCTGNGDGWWVEGLNGKNGWAFGEGAADSDRDTQDAEAIYRILEEEIIPLYYRVSDDGIPHEWVKIMKESIKGTARRGSPRGGWSRNILRNTMQTHCKRNKIKVSGVIG